MFSSLTCCLVPASCHFPQPRIAEFWFVQELPNLEIGVYDQDGTVIPLVLLVSFAHLGHHRHKRLDMQHVDEFDPFTNICIVVKLCTSLVCVSQWVPQKITKKTMAALRHNAPCLHKNKRTSVVVELNTPTSTPLSNSFVTHVPTSEHCPNKYKKSKNDMTV